MPAYASEIEWGRLPAAEIRRRAEAGAIVMIPMGATEQHGPHLPTMVDHRLAFEVACRAARIVAGRALVLVTPVIPFGMSEHHVSLGGTITLDYATMAAVVGCVVESAVRQGFRRVFVLNGHGGNVAPLEAIVAELTVRHRLPIACADLLAARLGRARRNARPAGSRAPRLRGRDLDDARGRGRGGRGRDPVPMPRRARSGRLGDRGGERGRLSLAPDRHALAERRRRGRPRGEPRKGERLLEAAAAALAAALRTPALWSAPI